MKFELPEAASELLHRRPKRPELIGETWLNTNQPLTFIDLAGKFVLVHFWTYSSYTCQNTLSYLKRWWEQYQGHNFVFIGIHTPEFDFEQNPKNVAEAIKQFDITWPVLLDNDYLNWDTFGNEYWPAFYLSDHNGHQYFASAGDQQYPRIEEHIQELILSTSTEVSFHEIESKEHVHIESCITPTEETYCGNQSGVTMNDDGFQFEKEYTYTTPTDKDWPDGVIGLEGSFFSSHEYAEGIDQNAKLTLQFNATEVNLVFGPGEDDEPTTITVRLDGQPLYDEIRGRDVNSSDQVTATYPQLYNLIRSDKPLQGKLEIHASNKFRAYTFTFSGCKPTD